jgi:hypothetical protein
MITRNEIVKFMAACRKSHLPSRFDVRAIAEEFADQLVLINDEHERQVAVMKAEFDAGNTAQTAKTELRYAKLSIN